MTFNIIQVIAIRALYKFFYSVGSASLKIKRGQVDQDARPCVPASTLKALEIVEPVGVQGITTQRSATETIGNPYLDGDVFCVFDYFDFTEGHMVFDNQFAADNAALFCADEMDTTYSHVSQLTADSIVTYLKDEAQDHGIPIFVYHADIKLDEAQTLDVILAQLMGDYYYFTRGMNKSKRWEFTSNNTEDLQSYLPEKSCDNKTLATIINLAKADGVSALSCYYNRMNGMVHSHRQANLSSCRIKNKSAFRQKISNTSLKSKLIKKQANSKTY